MLRSVGTGPGQTMWSIAKIVSEVDRPPRIMMAIIQVLIECKVHDFGP